MDMFNLAQLTKHMVIRNVRDGAKDPYAAAAETVRETLRTYLKGMSPGNPEIEQGVKEVGRGTMTGLLLCDAPMPKGAVAVLKAVAELSPELPHDPSVLFTSTIHGIAEMRLLLSIDALALIQDAIEKELMGAGEVMRKYLETRGVDNIAFRP